MARAVARAGPLQIKHTFVGDGFSFCWTHTQSCSDFKMHWNADTAPEVYEDGKYVAVGRRQTWVKTSVHVIEIEKLQ